MPRVVIVGRKAVALTVPLGNVPIASRRSIRAWNGLPIAFGSWVVHWPFRASFAFRPIQKMRNNRKGPVVVGKLP